MAQLEDNLQALEVQLSSAHLETLEAISRPQLNFPAEFLQRAGNFARGGATLNGETSMALPLAPTSEKPAY